MNFRTLAAAAVLGLALTGTGYAACDQTGTKTGFYWSWPKNSDKGDGTNTAAKTNSDQSITSPAQRAEADKDPAKACN